MTHLRTGAVRVGRGNRVEWELPPRQPWMDGAVCAQV